MPESLSIAVTRNGVTHTLTLPPAEVPLLVDVAVGAVRVARKPDGARGDRSAAEAQALAERIARQVFDFDATTPNAIPGFGGPRHDRYARALGMEVNGDEVKQTAPGELRDRFLALTATERANFGEAR